MNFQLSQEQELLRKNITELMKSKFNDAYWQEHDRTHTFPAEFWGGMQKLGIMGTVIPDKYGGSGLGMLDLALVIEEVANVGGPGAGILFILTSVFGAEAVIHHGNEEQKEKYLPRLASGDMLMAMALTEPNAGSNTLATETRAEDKGDYFLINGSKQFISGIQQSSAMLLITRTKPLKEVKKKTEGLTLFIVDEPRKNESISYQPIDKLGLRYVPTNQVWINDLVLPKSAVLGEIDQGWYHILDVLNPERIAGTACAVGGGNLAIRTAVKYANERYVFGRAIGTNQGIQFPLAEMKIKLEAARLLMYKAAQLYDTGLPCGAEANMAKYLATEAGTEACDWAIQVLGGYGYTEEYNVERYWREMRLTKIAPISNQMVLNFVGEHVLGLPKSY